MIDRSRNRPTRIVSLPCRNPDELDPSKAEHHHDKTAQHSADAGWKESSVSPQVTYPGRRATTQASCNDKDTQHDHRKNRDDFDDSEPELEFSVGSHCREVDNSNEHEKGPCGQPLRNLWEPEVDVFSHHRKLSHGDGDVVKPVVVTRDESSAWAPVAVGVIAESP